VPAQLLGGAGLSLPRSARRSAVNRGRGVARRAQRVGDFHQTGDFGGEHQRDVSSVFPTNDNYFLVVNDPVRDARKVFP
jgi:hypothetical protein